MSKAENSKKMVTPLPLGRGSNWVMDRAGEVFSFSLTPKIHFSETLPNIHIPNPVEIRAVLFVFDGGTLTKSFP